MATPKVDKEKCIGCGACAALCPKVFKMSSDGKSKVINPKGCNGDCDCENAKDNCPTGAISLS